MFVEECLKSYLDGFMWHERHTSNKFDAFCHVIASQYIF